jgi:hypothetical protein
MPRTLAKTMREILPDAVPGKTLSQCSSAEFVQLVVRRHVERAVHEKLLGDRFLSDGSSLQEWAYGTARVVYGIDPSATARLGNVAGPGNVEKAGKSQEMRYFEEVFAQLGHAFKQHVRSTFDGFVHLRHELPLVNDGHRPMNDHFRSTCDAMLRDTLGEIKVPYHVVGGSIPQRLEAIVDLFSLPRLMRVDEAIALAEQDYAKQDLRFESQRRSRLAARESTA